MGELLALRWRDVDAGRTIRVRASYYAGQLTTPKWGKVRAVPMAPNVASALAQLGQREHCRFSYSRQDFRSPVKLQATSARKGLP
jgi:integrase